MAIGAVIFIVERDDFRGRTHAHLVAAATLFVGLIVVTIANAVIQWKIKQAKDTTRTYVLLYSVLAGVMVVSAAGLLIAHWILGDQWSRWLFWLELDVISLFITFWILQSRALWNWVTPSEQLAEANSRLSWSGRVRAPGRPPRCGCARRACRGCGSRAS